MLTICSWVGEAANVLTQVNIAGVFKGPRPFKSEATLRGCNCNTGHGVVAGSERGCF